MPALIVLIAVVVIPLLIVVAMYNNLVRARNHCDEAWSGVDTELQRRYNLIPDLVSTVKGYAEHERELLENLARLREQRGLCWGTSVGPSGSEDGHSPGARPWQWCRLRSEDRRSNPWWRPTSRSRPGHHRGVRRRCAQTS